MSLRTSTALFLAGTSVGLFVIATATLLLSREARAHEAPTGWSFDPLCCSNRDCGEVPADWISEGPAGVTVKPTGELLSYTDKRVKQSKDERTYWCRPPGDPNPKTICIYLPPKGY
jgi:hypothetical protein